MKYSFVIAMLFMSYTESRRIREMLMIGSELEA